jgi:hypothetical protein
MVKLNNILFHTAMSLFFRSRNVGEPSKTSYNACVNLREADREELRMMRLDPFVFLLEFRNGDSLGKRGSHSPLSAGANRAIKILAGPPASAQPRLCQQFGYRAIMRDVPF